MRNVTPFYQREGLLYVVAMLASVLISCWVSLRETVVNPDAICYLLSAETIAKSGLIAGMQTCGQAAWPFYSLLLYGFVQLTHVSYEIAAYLLDGFFSMLSVVTFIAIIKECGGAGRVLWLAAAVMLLSHEFNSVRQYIVRDHGFWAFYLISILCLLRYFRDPRWMKAIAWSVSLAIAALFRVEGAFFLLALPFLAFVGVRDSWMRRLTAFVSLQLLSIAVCLLIAGWLALHPEETIAKLGRLHEVVDRLQSVAVTMAYRFQTTKLAFAQYILVPESARDAGLVLSLTLGVWYLVSVLVNLSWAYGFLVLYAWFTHAASLSRAAILVLSGYLLINLAITFTFFAEHLFLSKRYLIAFSLVFMIWAPFALEKLLQQRPVLRDRALLILVVFGIFISSLGGLFNFGYSKRYIRDAGVWLAQNVPANESLYSNSGQVMYYSKHFEEGFYKSSYRYNHTNIAKTDDWKHYHYIALRLGVHESNGLLTALENSRLQPMQEFANKRGDRVVIYKMPHEEKIP
jgi:hypothetical protein